MKVAIGAAVVAALLFTAAPAAAKATRCGPTVYTVGYYGNLRDALHHARRYRDAANFVRSRPHLYTEAEACAAFHLEAASLAEVRRLRAEAREQMAAPSQTAILPSPGFVRPPAAAPTKAQKFVSVF